MPWMRVSPQSCHHGGTHQIKSKELKNCNVEWLQPDAHRQLTVVLSIIDDSLKSPEFNRSVIHLAQSGPPLEPFSLEAVSIKVCVFHVSVVVEAVPSPEVVRRSNVSHCRLQLLVRKKKCSLGCKYNISELNRKRLQKCMCHGCRDSEFWSGCYHIVLA